MISAMQALKLITRSPEQTQQLGSHIGQLATGGDIYLLSGNLGTGKTCLVQGIAFGLGVKEYACSPSFMIAREYHGRLALYHLDLYRLDHIEEIIDLGINEYFKDDSVCAIEWAEKGGVALPHDSLIIRLRHLPGDERELTFEPKGKRYVELIRRFKEIVDTGRGGKWNSA